ncbi:uncharacterized protein N7479_004292 [Penicillium vulpinum]|uniref:Glutathione S-transferase kappa n=1 Tax=Penicillium vulpinum TaxID=29845 RepID=A0A1V6SDF2_9EURO|nr:uncharacterized protein N7479_004292 [Penicillium vulpinum]KAJ5964416.1 hypothetical protein N7479_004292 [Penicillium vulpinum]OQE11779.1 hypothetical protein PENVUL_c002G06041 [Penicillium vulpinum]
MAGSKITCYVDIVSPFAYIAFHVLQNSPAFAKCEVTYVPMLLGGLMNACGNSPPINITNKKDYLGRQRLRWAKYFSVPIIEGFPKGFPFRTLSVQRVLCAISQKAPENLAPVIGALFHAIWVEGSTTIAEPEGFTPVIESVLGKQEAHEMISAMNNPDVKALLIANTDRSFASGAFGLPWLECTNSKGETEGFFGVDHLGQVADFLGLDRALDKGFRAAL